MKRQGNKYTTSHTTAIDAASPILDFAEKSLLVDKIVLGIIKTLKNGTKRMKTSHEEACLFAKVRGNRAIQEFRFYTKEIPRFEKELNRIAKDEGFEIS